MCSLIAFAFHFSIIAIAATEIFLVLCLSVSLKEKICGSFISWGWLLQVVKDRLDSLGVAREFYGLIQLLSLARWFTIVAATASLLVNLGIQLMRTRCTSGCTVTSWLVVVAASRLMFSMARRITRTAIIWNFDFLYLMLLLLSWPGCSLSIWSRGWYLGKIKYIVEHLVISCFWGIDS